MQAMGIVNDHTINCFRNQEIAILNSKNRDDFYCFVKIQKIN